MKYDAVFLSRLKKLENDNKKFLRRLTVLENNVSILLDDAFKFDFSDLFDASKSDYFIREYFDSMELRGK